MSYKPMPTFAEDTAHASGDKGIQSLTVRKDTAAATADSDGDYQPLTTDGSGRLHVNGSSVTQPVSAASLPLPTGAATSAKQDTLIGHVDGLEGLLTTIDGDTGNISTKIDTVAGAVSGTEMQVDVVASLPAGTNNIGDVDIASIAAGDNNIGNVDIASAIPAGDNNIGNVDLASAIPAGNNNIGDVDVASIAAGDNTVGRVKLTDGTDVADILDLTNANPLTVAIVDGDGTQVTSFGGGTQYTEDAAAAANPTGTMGMAVRQDTLSGTTVSADGDNIALRATGKGELYVKQTDAVPVTDNGSSITVDGTVTADTELPAAAALADSTSNPTVPAVGNFGHAWDSNAATWSRQQSIRHGMNTAGTGVTAAGLLIEFDDTAPTSVTENQFAPLRGSSRREVYTQIRDAAGNERGLNIDANGALAATVSGTVTANAGTGNFNVNLQDGAGTDLTSTTVGSDVGLDVNIIGGSSSGTQYTEGDTDASITGTAIMWEDGSDTLRAVSAAKPLPVDLQDSTVAVTDNGGSLTVDGTVAATQSGTWTLGANSGTDIGDVTINNASGAAAVNIQDGGNSITVDGTVGVSGTVAVTQSGTWDEVGINDSGNSITVDAPVDTPVFVRLSDGSSAIATLPVSLASVPSHAVTNAGTFAVQPTAAATGGYTPGKVISAASTNATSIKTSAGTLGYITASNTNAAARYLKIYNKASSPTVGTDTPIHTFLIPGNTAGAGTNIPLPPQGIALGTGIALAITTGAADSDSGAVAASEIIVNYGYN